MLMVVTNCRGLVPLFPPSQQGNITAFLDFLDRVNADIDSFADDFNIDVCSHNMIIMERGVVGLEYTARDPLSPKKLTK
jgi:hypothetical protein